MKISHPKYKNIKVFYDNVWFDSILEVTRYKKLSFLKYCEKIKDLRLQPKFLLQEKYVDSMGNKHSAIYYIADFIYYDHDINKWVIEDVKGMRTAVYLIKKKLFLKILPDNTVFREIYFNHRSKKTK